MTTMVDAPIYALMMAAIAQTVGSLVTINEHVNPILIRLN